MPLSKAKIKWVKSLDSKRGRDESGLFVVEGPKAVAEFVDYFECVCLFAESEWIDRSPYIIGGGIETTEVTNEELRRISSLKTPRDVLGVFRQREERLRPELLCDELSLFLDDVQDPGNVGTIIRIADWYGIRSVVCSKATADVYNPKTIQATMGALCRTHVHYVDKQPYFESLRGRVEVFGTYMDGDNIYRTPLPERGIVVMGNEGAGISPDVSAFVTRRLSIPSYPVGVRTSESLNVAVSAAIVCSEFRRSLF